MSSIRVFLSSVLCLGSLAAACSPSGSAPASAPAAPSSGASAPAAPSSGASAPAAEAGQATPSAVAGAPGAGAPAASPGSGPGSAPDAPSGVWRRTVGFPCAPDAAGTPTTCNGTHELRLTPGSAGLGVEIALGDCSFDDACTVRFDAQPQEGGWSWANAEGNCRFVLTRDGEGLRLTDPGDCVAHSCGSSPQFSIAGESFARVADPAGPRCDDGKGKGDGAAAAAPSPTAPGRAAPARPTAEDARARGAAIRRHLSEGRKAVRAKDYAAGIRAFRQALEHDPAHGTVLGELGWAHFLNGELDLAEEATQKALRLLHDPSLRGATLYNAGRIHEARGETVAAAVRYEESLRVRPGNTVVLKRLEDILMNSEPEGDSPTCAFRAVALEMPENPCVAWVAATRAKGAVCGDGAQSVRGNGWRAVLFSVDTSAEEEGGGYHQSIVLAVTASPGSWYHQVIHSAYTPGVSYMSEDVSGTVTAVDVLPDAGDELLLRWEVNGRDGDYSENVLEFWGQTNEGLLRIERGVPVWVGGLAVATTRGVDVFIEGEPVGDGAPKLETTTRAVSTRWADGSVTIGAHPEHPPLVAAGTLAADQLPFVCPSDNGHAWMIRVNFRGPR